MTEPVAAAENRLVVFDDEDGAVFVVGDCNPAAALDAIRRFTADCGEPGPPADAAHTLTTGWYITPADAREEDDLIYQPVAAGTPGAVLLTAWQPG